MGLAFTMVEPYPGYSRIVNMIKSCCVHNGGRTWCDFSGPLAGGVPCGEGAESKVGGTTGFCCRVCLSPRIAAQTPYSAPFIAWADAESQPWHHGTMVRRTSLSWDKVTKYNLLAKLWFTDHSVYII